ncbi:MAG: hypothetical protein AB1512_25245 [Thermodesulfobacteriota bacterium]
MTRKSWISDNEGLRKAFRDAYWAKEEQGTLRDGWKGRIMSRIRRVGPLKPAAGFWPAFEHVVWRLAPISCLLVLALGALFASTDFDLAYDYLDTVRSEMERPVLVELFGLEG